MCSLFTLLQSRPLHDTMLRRKLKTSHACSDISPFFITLRAVFNLHIRRQEHTVETTNQRHTEHLQTNLQSTSFFTATTRHNTWAPSYCHGRNRVHMYVGIQLLTLIEFHVHFAQFQLMVWWGLAMFDGDCRPRDCRPRLVVSNPWSELGNTR